VALAHILSLSPLIHCAIAMGVMAVFPKARRPLAWLGSAVALACYVWLVAIARDLAPHVQVPPHLGLPPSTPSPDAAALSSIVSPLFRASLTTALIGFACPPRGSGQLPARGTGRVSLATVLAAAAAAGGVLIAGFQWRLMVQTWTPSVSIANDIVATSIVLGLLGCIASGLRRTRLAQLGWLWMCLGLWAAFPEAVSDLTFVDHDEYGMPLVNGRPDGIASMLLAYKLGVMALIYGVEHFRRVPRAGLLRHVGCLVGLGCLNLAVGFVIWLQLIELERRLSEDIAFLIVVVLTVCTWWWLARRYEKKRVERSAAEERAALKARSDGEGTR